MACPRRGDGIAFYNSPRPRRRLRERRNRAPSQPEIGLLDHLVLPHFRRRSRAGDPAVLEDIDVIGELEALVGVLLDEDDRLPALGQATKNREEIADQP